MSGGGPAADSAGNVYVLTANGRFDTTLNAGGFPSRGDYGNSFVKISSSGGALGVADYFTMSGEVAESTNDGDLGSGGIMLLPDMSDASGTVRHLAVGAGKDSNIYVVDRDNMGKFTSVGNNIWQELDAVLGGGVWATPAYFNLSIYYGPQGGSLKAFSLTNAQLSSSPTSQTSTQFTYPGTFPVVSANGTANAIVWAYETRRLRCFTPTQQAISLPSCTTATRPPTGATSLALATNTLLRWSPTGRCSSRPPKASPFLACCRDVALRVPAQFRGRSSRSRSKNATRERSG